jgi:hypothetical protein
MLLISYRVQSRYDADNTQRYSYFPADSEVNLTDFDKLDSIIEHFALNMLARVIALEEKRMGKMSGLRVFCRLDVSIYRDGRGEYNYFVNEITRTHGAGLFPQWDSNNKLDLLLSNMSNTLHDICSQKLFFKPPLSFE